jgi:hypothetical protein
MEINTMYGTYLILFLKVGYHDDGGAVKLPYHPPEVRESGRLRTLSGYVRIRTIETLRQRERERERERERGRERERMRYV